MRSSLALMLSAALMAQPAPKTDATTKTLKNLGEAGKYGLPAAALLETLLRGNREDTAAFLWSFGTTAIETEAIKRLASKQRPDFTDTDAFPSGHTAAAFSGALFIQDREGWRWGVPAISLAALTAYGRVRAGEHGWDDVIGGFGLALLNHRALAASDASHRLWIAPWTAGDASGIQVGLQTSAAPAERNGEFLLWMESPQIEGNQVGGSFAAAPDRTPTAGLRIELKHGPGIWSFLAAPQTSQSYQTLMVPQGFGGQVLPADAQLAQQTVLVDLRAAYTWKLGSPETGGSLGAGLGLDYGSHQESFALPDQPWIREQAQAFLPVLRAESVWNPCTWLTGRVTGEAGSLRGNRMREVTTAIRFNLPRGYGIEAGAHDTAWTFNRDATAASMRNRGLRLGLSLAW